MRRRAAEPAWGVRALVGTIEETAELVAAASGESIPVPTDHAEPAQVAALVERVRDEQGGRLDVLVNNIWGGDPLIDWEAPFWQHSLGDGLHAMRQAVETHLITSWHAGPLMLERGHGLIVEINDGTGDEGYRGNLFRPGEVPRRSARPGAGCVAGRARHHRPLRHPGFPRSEAILDHFGVDEQTWREGAERDPHFLESETPRYIGRAVAALAADRDVARYHGGGLSTVPPRARVRLHRRRRHAARLRRLLRGDRRA